VEDLKPEEAAVLALLRGRLAKEADSAGAQGFSGKGRVPAP